MKSLVFRKHKTQARFWDYSSRIYVDIHQIAIEGVKAKKIPLIIDHAGKDITAQYIFSGKKVAGL